MPRRWAWLLLSAANLAAVISQQPQSSQCDAAGPRIACGYNGISADKCASSGCCYGPAPTTEGGTPIQLPPCFYVNGAQSAYSLQGALQQGAGGAQLGTLVLQGNSTLPQAGRDISPLTLSVENLDRSILRIKLGAPGRWEVPAAQLFTSTAQGQQQGTPTYSLQYSSSPFGFAVSRAGSAAPLFNTAGNRIIFKDQYLEISSAIPSDAVLFGLGERTSSTGFALRRDGVPYTLWARDQAPNTPNVNLYGSHPFILDMRPGGLAHGLLLLNSNGIDVALTSTKLQLRAVGGVLDLYFFTGPTPMEVLSQLTSVVGRPLLPPYWSLGLMNSKFGYPSVDYISDVVEKYKEAQIPLETFVTDLDYAGASEDFTLSAAYAQPKFSAFVQRLHNAGQRWVPILNPGIHNRQGYVPYDQGLAQDVFIKDITGKPYVGQLWPGAVSWPDFLSQRAAAWWTAQLQAFYDQIPLDGVWLDMNEPSNFCTGDVCVQYGDVPASTSYGCSLSCQNGAAAAGSNAANLPPAGVFTPPYSINNAGVQLPINTKTVAASARNLDGSLQYDTHNLYGLAMVAASAQALRSVRGKRPFILTRSTFLGSGAYAAHWTGDTASAWDDLHWSIGDMLANGMSGVALIGADICGFQDSASEELCARWAAAGAWQPLARDHHAQGFQELYLWDSVRAVSQKAFQWRLRLLPYHYTAFYDAHTYGCPVMRPTFFGFPGDPAALALDQQWMLGDALLVAPVLQQGASSTVAYFGQGLWYNLYDHSTVDATSGGRNQTVYAAPTDNPPVYVLGGNIVPIGVNGTNTTTGARTGNLTLRVALPGANSPDFKRCGQGCASTSGPGNLVACGHMYLDGGEDLEVGSARSNYLAYEARLVGGPGGARQGALALFWPGPPGQGAGAVCGGVPWPLLDGVTVLGGGPVDTGSITVVEVGSQSSADAVLGASGMVQAQSASPSLPPGSVVYNASADALSISALAHQLRCPTALKLTWTATGAPGAGSPTIVAPALASPSALVKAG